jgi:hypothetical protein
MNSQSNHPNLKAHLGTPADAARFPKIQDYIEKYELPFEKVMRYFWRLFLLLKDIQLIIDNMQIVGITLNTLYYSTEHLDGLLLIFDPKDRRDKEEEIRTMSALFENAELLYLYDMNSIFSASEYDQVQFVKYLLLQVSDQNHVNVHHQEAIDEAERKWPMILNYHSTVYKQYYLCLLIITATHYHSSHAPASCAYINSLLLMNRKGMAFPPSPSIVYRRNTILHDQQLVHYKALSEKKKTPSRQLFSLFPFRTYYTARILETYFREIISSRARGWTWGLLKAVLRSINMMDSVCVLDHHLNFHDPIKQVEDRLLIFVEKLRQDCLSTSKRFIIIMFSFSCDAIAHANLLILDKHTQTMEHFEPHGVTGEPFGKIIVGYMNRVISELSLKESFLYTYFPPQSFNCDFQVTEKEGDAEPFERGYCYAWTFIYLVHRLRYPNMSRAILVRRLRLAIVRKEMEDNTSKNSISLLNSNPLLEYARRCASWLVMLNQDTSSRHEDQHKRKIKYKLSIKKGSQSKSRSRSRSTRNSKSKSSTVYYTPPTSLYFTPE